MTAYLHIVVYCFPQQAPLVLNWVAKPVFLLYNIEFTSDPVIIRRDNYLALLPDAIPSLGSALFSQFFLQASFDKKIICLFGTFHHPVVESSRTVKIFRHSRYGNFDSFFHLILWHEYAIPSPIGIRPAPSPSLFYSQCR
ncbi:MAG: hypothetical protein DDT30_01079 [Dehalococcoidia bacterium]|nr:hypothetical protein [Bacillota bacterium]MBT9142428.1 hypothetical protein [Bacillota bacterium]